MIDVKYIVVILEQFKKLTLLKAWVIFIEMFYWKQ